MNKAHVIYTSTRPNRAAEPIAKWVTERAKAKFDVTYVDLREVNLPLMDEAEHPRAQKYQHEHTKAWSKLIDAADAFFFVLPEYNYSMPPAFLNAINYLFKEWTNKAAGLISYGGVSAGLRSAQQAKQVLTALNVMPVSEAMQIPLFTQFIKDGVFTPNDALEKGADMMFTAVDRWATALKGMREAHAPKA